LGKVRTVVCGFADFLDVCLGRLERGLEYVKVDIYKKLLSARYSVVYFFMEFKIRFLRIRS